MEHTFQLALYLPARRARSISTRSTTLIPMFSTASDFRTPSTLRANARPGQLHLTTILPLAMGDMHGASLFDFPKFSRLSHLCHSPGRFFASNMIKALVAHLLMMYDVKLEKEGVRPPDHW